jgi:hypothetical protein
MRSFALSLAIVSPCIVAAACGDNLDAGDDSTSEVQSNDGDHPDAGMEEPRAIISSLLLTAPSCDAAVADFEVDVLYADDRSLVPNRACTMTFDDGTVYDQCIGSHTFADGGFHDYLLEVRDLDSGATERTEGRRYIEYPLLVTFEAQAPACGLEVSYAGTVNVSAFSIAHISPAENVVGDAFSNSRDGSFQVTQPGTYTVTFSVEDERAIPICEAQITREVTVTACPDEHPHEPGCGHM